MILNVLRFIYNHVMLEPTMLCYLPIRFCDASWQIIILKNSYYVTCLLIRVYIVVSPSLIEYKVVTLACDKNCILYQP